MLRVCAPIAEELEFNEDRVTVLATLSTEHTGTVFVFVPTTVAQVVEVIKIEMLVGKVIFIFPLEDKASLMVMEKV